jgi:hypothetical protein
LSWFAGEGAGRKFGPLIKESFANGLAKDSEKLAESITKIAIAVNKEPWIWDILVP